eukprot:CAMPEP_0172077082 /NCGR_PEP_ID=MMETSP1043-20130122/16866_1 /TAXON_ID=464988 /ORGANISM="Hemiselmis andersenii, Strain CCMP441" /LENGTH=91 /DNA_ID=CAMNT_0012738007 /DNA_START=1 /DNA_END=272 /DNA_ORIENTATION=+
MALLLTSSSTISEGSPPATTATLTALEALLPPLEAVTVIRSPVCEGLRLSLPTSTVIVPSAGNSATLRSTARHSNSSGTVWHAHEKESAAS